MIICVSAYWWSTDTTATPVTPTVTPTATATVVDVPEVATEPVVSLPRVVLSEVADAEDVLNVVVPNPVEVVTATHTPPHLEKREGSEYQRLW